MTASPSAAPPPTELKLKRGRRELEVQFPDGVAAVLSAEYLRVHSPSAEVTQHGVGEGVLVVGKDNHRHAFARAAVDRLRAERERVLVVDMGWPSDDRAYADIATFGASRLVGRALLRLLGHGS